jgi:hypothetical protein
LAGVGGFIALTSAVRRRQERNGIASEPRRGHSSGTHLIPRTQPAAPDLAAAEAMRLNSGAAAVPPPQATVTFVQHSQPLLGADAAPAGTSAKGAAVNSAKPPALAPVRARAEATAPWLLDRLFAEPESGALGVLSAGEPSWSRP